MRDLKIPSHIMDDSLYSGSIALSDLFAAGYRYFESRTLQSHAYCGSMQKRFDDERGKKYFITFDIYDGRTYQGYFSKTPLNMSPKVQFRSGDDYVNVEFILGSDTTLAELEEKYEAMFQLMKFDHYSMDEDFKPARQESSYQTPDVTV